MDGLEGIFWRYIQQDMDVESKGDGEFKDDSGFGLSMWVDGGSFTE